MDVINIRIIVIIDMQEYIFVTSWIGFIHYKPFGCHDPHQWYDEKYKNEIIKLWIFYLS